MRELNIGEFQECDYGNYFTYRKTDNLWAIEQGYMHEIDVGDCQVRFARVLKTVAYVCTDEDKIYEHSQRLLTDIHTAMQAYV